MQRAPALSRQGKRPYAGPGGARHLVLTLAVAALAAGCATTPPPLAAPGEPAMSRWIGRFAVSWTEAASPPRTGSASGRFALTEAGDRIALDVFSPFGQTVARAQAGPNGATLEAADGQRHEAASPEALTEAVLGWRIPVRQLPDWLGGAHPDRILDAGWLVSVEAREDGRPSRLTLRWPAEYVRTATRDVTIRLILDTPEARDATR